MDVVDHLILGFQIVLQPENLIYCFVGVFIGTLIGVLPGIGPVGAMSLLMPATFRSSPVAAVIMLAGIYYGAQYGGSTTSILVNIPGEATSVMTCLDGYQMAKKGRAGPALGMAAIASFIAGTISILGLMFLSVPLAKAALAFGPPEYFALMCLGLLVVTFLGHGSMYKALMMALVGLLIGFVGMDLFTASFRFTFGLKEIEDGIGIVPVIMGLFGLAEILTNIERPLKREIYEAKIKGLLPNVQDWMAAKGAILRGTAIGFFSGILPGSGAIVGSFASYAVEKKISKYPEKFGSGVIEGLAAPEAANNAAAQSSFIPLLSLGIPPNVVMAVLFGGLLIHGIQPGPLLIVKHPDIFWGVLASMYIGNIMLLALNLPLIGLWIRILKVPYAILFPLILFFCVIGAYSVRNSVADIYLMVIFGLFGYLLRKFDFEPAPLVLAYVLSPLFETALRQSLLMSGGNFSILFSSCIALVCFALFAALLLFQLVSRCWPQKSTTG
jgi:putative tricarboxylic transport membrane protein